MSDLAYKILFVIARWSLNSVVKRNPSFIIPIHNQIVSFARCKLTQKEIQQMEADWDIVKSNYGTRHE